MDDGKALAILIGKVKPKGKHMMKGGEYMDDEDMPSKKDEDDEDGMGIEMAMEDFLSAMKKDDAKGMADAFKTAVEMCEY